MPMNQKSRLLYTAFLMLIATEHEILTAHKPQKMKNKMKNMAVSTSLLINEYLLAVIFKDLYVLALKWCLF